MTKTDNIFVKYGVPNDLALELNSLNLTLSIFNNLSTKLIIDKYKLSKEQVTFVKACIKRSPIDEVVIQELLSRSNFTCCICKGGKSDAFLIHHIIEYSETQDNSYDNLAVLCPNDHDLAHRKGIFLTKKLTPSTIKQEKKDWELMVRRYNTLAAINQRTDIKWSEEASKIADHIRKKHMDIHRGAILFDVNTTVVFGNDGFDLSDVVKQEVKILRDIIAQNKFRYLGFGLCKESYSWCVLVETNAVNFLNEVVWNCYPRNDSFKIQSKIANEGLLKYQDELLKNNVSL